MDPTRKQREHIKTKVNIKGAPKKDSEYEMYVNVIVTLTVAAAVAVAVPDEETYIEPAAVRPGRSLVSFQLSALLLCNTHSQRWRERE